MQCIDFKDNLTVERLDPVFIFFEHNAPLQLQRLGQCPVFYTERLFQEQELLWDLIAGVLFLQEVLNLTADHLLDVTALHQLIHI